LISQQREKNSPEGREGKNKEQFACVEGVTHTKVSCLRTQIDFPDSPFITHAIQWCQQASWACSAGVKNEWLSQALAPTRSLRGKYK